MLRVYLDQNKWIDLARAATGHRDGARFVGALASAQADVASGTASFPLDIYRYLETARRADHRSRLDVADLMFELSKQHGHSTAGLAAPRNLSSTRCSVLGCVTSPLAV